MVNAKKLVKANFATVLYTLILVVKLSDLFNLFSNKRQEYDLDLTSFILQSCGNHLWPFSCTCQKSLSAVRDI